MSRRVEDELREVLSARADSVPAEHDPYERTARGIRRARWRRSLTVALCVCVVAAAAAPIAVFRPFMRSSPMAWPVRGALADDTAFRTAVAEEARDWLEFWQPDLRIRSSRVVYAGEGAQRRRAVVAMSVRPSGSAEITDRAGDGRTDAPRTYVRLALLSGPQGAAGDRLRHQTSALFLPGGAAVPEEVLRSTPEAVRAPVPGVAWIEKHASGGAELFVLGPPDTQAMAYSPRVTFHPDGTWERSWYPLPARDGHDGVAQRAVANPRAAADLLRLDLPRGRVTVPVGGGDRPPDAIVKQRVSGVLRDVSGAGDPDAAPRGRTDDLRHAVAALHRQTGIPPGKFEIRVRWHGDRQGRPDRQGRRQQGRPDQRGPGGWLLSATLPSGVTFQVVSLRGGSLGNHVVLVPQGEGGRPAAVAEPEPRRSDTGPGRDAGAQEISAEDPGEDSAAGEDSAQDPGEDSAAGQGAGGTGQVSEEDPQGEDSRKGPGPYSDDDSGDSDDSGDPQDSESEEPCPDFDEDPESWDDYGDDELPDDTEEPVTRVIAVAPGHSNGYAQLWLRGEKLATAPVDEAGRAVFDGHLVECVVEDAEGEADAYGVEDLQVRVVGGSGREIYRGPVHGAGEPPPWNRPYEARGESRN